MKLPAAFLPSEYNQLHARLNTNESQLSENFKHDQWSRAAQNYKHMVEPLKEPKSPQEREFWAQVGLTLANELRMLPENAGSNKHDKDFWMNVGLSMVAQMRQTDVGIPEDLYPGDLPG